MADTVENLAARALALPCFAAPQDARPLEGGKTNHNLLVEDRGRRHVVRFGEDIPEHGILRWNELALSRAAEAAGVGPAVIYAAPGVLVLEHLDARPLEPADLTREGMIGALAALVRRVHHDVMREASGPVLAFHVFHILRGYARLLAARGSPHLPLLPKLMEEGELLERAVGTAPTVLGHNDLLPGNILTDGARLWLIDWEYGGLGNPLFDLGGLAGNNGFTPDQERALLTAHDGHAPDAARWRAYGAMKCASLLRETLWSMVSEITSTLDVDYRAYTAANLEAYRAAFAALQSGTEIE